MDASAASLPDEFLKPRVLFPRLRRTRRIRRLSVSTACRNGPHVVNVYHAALPRAAVAPGDGTLAPALHWHDAYRLQRRVGSDVP